VAINHPIADHIDRRYQRCCHPRRQRRTQQRWSRYPALAGRTVPEIRDALTGCNADHNPTIAALLRAHQAGDDDATTILLAAFTGYVYAYPTLRVIEPLIADRWAAVARLLVVIDPDEAHRVGDRPFLKVIVNRMRRDAARLRYLPQPAVPTAPDQLCDTVPTRAAPVEDQALARIDLAIIGSHVRDGTVAPHHWQLLVAGRVHGIANTNAYSTISRTHRRLARLTGRAA
jgi:hypothetical protein